MPTILTINWTNGERRPRLAFAPPGGAEEARCCRSSSRGAVARARRRQATCSRWRFFAAGQQVQCFASYGGARRGTPVSSFLRVDTRPIRLRCDIERADAILCFDASLLDGPLLACGRADTLIVVNSMRDERRLSPPRCRGAR
jgi:hypothetical protein